MKRTLALMLALLMLTPLLAACGSGDDNIPASTTAAPAVADTTPAPETTADPIKANDPLPADMKFEGETIRFYARDHWWVDDEITVSELSGEVVNDAVYKREEMVEERLGITIEKTLGPENELDMVEQAKNLVLAQTDAYDVFSGAVYAIVPATVQGHFLNLLDLPNLDLENEWWAQGFNSEMSAGKAQYLATGDATLSLKRFTFATIFNKQLFTDNKIPDIYQTVRDRKWTITYQTELSTQMYADLNGNNKADLGDRFGFIAVADGINTDPYWSSFEMPILRKDADNWYVYDINIERLDRGLSLIRGLFFQETSQIIVNDGYNLEQDHLADRFANGEAAMLTLRLLNLENETVRNMSDEYGILPVPLMDENQTEYYSMAHDQFGVLCMPITVPAERYEAVGATLEYFGYISRQIVTPAYYEVALKTKYADDPQSGEMLDIIFDGFKIDAGVLYVLDLTVGVGPHQNLRVLAGESGGNAASTFSRVDKMTKKKLTTLMEKLQDNQ